jgi:hypothetical protein
MRLRTNERVRVNERFRLASGAVVQVMALRNEEAHCVYISGGRGAVAFVEFVLVRDAWRLHEREPIR